MTSLQTKNSSTKKISFPEYFPELFGCGLWSKNSKKIRTFSHVATATFICTKRKVIPTLVLAVANQLACQYRQCGNDTFYIITYICRLRESGPAEFTRKLTKLIKIEELPFVSPLRVMEKFELSSTLSKSASDFFFNM